MLASDWLGSGRKSACSEADVLQPLTLKSATGWQARASGSKLIYTDISRRERNEGRGGNNTEGGRRRERVEREGGGKRRTRRGRSEKEVGKEEWGWGLCGCDTVLQLVKFPHHEPKRQNLRLLNAFSLNHSAGSRSEMQESLGLLKRMIYQLFHIDFRHRGFWNLSLEVCFERGLGLGYLSV